MIFSSRNLPPSPLYQHTHVYTPPTSLPKVDTEKKERFLYLYRGIFSCGGLGNCIFSARSRPFYRLASPSLGSVFLLFDIPTNDDLHTKVHSLDWERRLGGWELGDQEGMVHEGGQFYRSGPCLFHRNLPGSPGSVTIFRLVLTRVYTFSPVSRNLRILYHFSLAILESLSV